MKIVVCGDSFCCPDAEYGPMWLDLLRQRLDADITNLACVGASNALISLQVDQALELSADVILCHFTSCTRSTYKVRSGTAPLLDRFAAGDLITYSIPTCTTLESAVPADEIDTIRRHYLQYCDLPMEIYLNKCVIESALWRLNDSGCVWQFDQGGFEHSSFGPQNNYFSNFSSNKSELNLWDFAKTRSFRPYYHIVDPATHNKIADYYQTWIERNTK